MLPSNIFGVLSCIKKVCEEASCTSAFWKVWFENIAFLEFFVQTMHKLPPSFPTYVGKEGGSLCIVCTINSRHVYQPPVSPQNLNIAFPWIIPPLGKLPLGTNAKKILTKRNWKRKKIVREVARGDKHYLRKPADRKAQISNALVQLSGAVCALRSAYLCMECLSPRATSCKISFSISNSFLVYWTQIIFFRWE